MVLESTIVCVDNSEYARNGDFSPSRFTAQVDSVNILCQAKVSSHPENTVGLLTTAGKSARILITATQDPGRVFSSMHDVSIDGAASVASSLQKAALALKHRQNLVSRQRIILFVSSPVVEDEAVLIALAKKLKKNNVALDIVHVSDDTDGANGAKLDSLIAAVNAGDNSRILHVPAGTGQVLADAIMASDIYAERDGGGGGAAADGGGGGGEGGQGGQGGGSFEFGVDPAVDPELAMVLRMSMEEENARQAAAAAGGAAAAVGAAAGGAADAEAPGGAAGFENEDADLYGTGAETGTGGDAMEVEGGGDSGELAEALAMSVGQGGGSAGAAAGSEGGGDEDDDGMDEEMRRAIEMSKADFDEGKQEKDGDGGGK